MNKTDKLIELIKNATSQQIVKLLLYCEQTKNHTEENQIHFLHLLTNTYENII